MSAPEQPPMGKVNFLPTFSFSDEGADWDSFVTVFSRIREFTFHVWYMRDGHVAHAVLSDLDFDQSWMTGQRLNGGYVTIGLDDLLHVQYC